MKGRLQRPAIRTLRAALASRLWCEAPEDPESYVGTDLYILIPISMISTMLENTKSSPKLGERGRLSEITCFSAFSGMRRRWFRISTRFFDRSCQSATHHEVRGADQDRGQYLDFRTSPEERRSQKLLKP
jgi:hypothetical protein